MQSASLRTVECAVHSQQIIEYTQSIESIDSTKMLKTLKKWNESACLTMKTRCLTQTDRWNEKKTRR